MLHGFNTPFPPSLSWQMPPKRGSGGGKAELGSYVLGWGHSPPFLFVCPVSGLTTFNFNIRRSAVLLIFESREKKEAYMYILYSAV